MMRQARRTLEIGCQPKVEIYNQDRRKAGFRGINFTVP